MYAIRSYYERTVDAQVHLAAPLQREHQPLGLHEVAEAGQLDDEKAFVHGHRRVSSGVHSRLRLSQKQPRGKEGS